MSTPEKTTPTTEDNLKAFVLRQIDAVKQTIPTSDNIAEIVEEILEKLAPAAVCRVFLVNVRWELPHFGGIPMPTGVCFYGFHTFLVTENAPGEGITEAQVKTMAMEQGALDKNLTVESVSVVPTGWRN